MEAGAAVTEGALGGGEGCVRERLCRAARRREEREAERLGRERRWREGVAREVLAGVEAGVHPEGRPGVRPAEQPDVAEAVAEFAEYLQKAWKILGPMFREVYCGCDEGKCLYMNDTVVCTFVAVAMLITKTGMAVTVCSEGVDPYDDKREKQDCEISAFKRMAPVLRGLMKKYPLCLVGDALYGCDSVWRICEGCGWKYITTFKEGRMSDVYGNVSLLFKGGDCESGELVKADGKPRTGTMKWAVGVETNAPDRYGINVIWGKVSFIADLTKQGKPKRPYVGMFATNLPVKDVDAADEIFCWGRRRWNIENVFKEQKHGGTGLKHRFENATNANKTWYYLMQIAWTLWQMFQRGFLLRLEAGCRKMTQFLWCEEIRTYIRHFGCVMLVPRYRLMCRAHL